MSEVELQCDWFEGCEAPSAGMAPHPVKGVIPVCRPHVDAFGIRLITTTSRSN